MSGPCKRARVLALWRPLCALVFVLVMARSASAAADDDDDKPTMRVPVEVIEVAGGRVYIQPGASAGLRRGGRVIIRKRRHQVIAATESFAILEPGKRLPSVGSKGYALVEQDDAAGEAQPLPPPRPLAAFRAQWPKAKPPAVEQAPKYVPLGPITEASQNRLAFNLQGQGLLPLSSGAEAIGQAALGARVHAEPFVGTPFSLDADVATRLWLARDLEQRRGRDSRPLVQVRELQAAYGDDLRAAAGRLRYAASGLGMLDGARVQAPVLEGLSLGAFGGLVPEPLDGQPSDAAARFGAELEYENLEAEWRPRASLTAHGSRFDGQTDERRLRAQLDLFPGASRMGGYLELSLFDADNPWNAAEQELSAAGADTSVQLGELVFGGRFDVRRPERSLWLASFLPPEWLCSPSASAAAGTVDDCLGDEVRYLGQLDAGLRGTYSAFTLGATVSRSTRPQSEQTGLFAQLRLLKLYRDLRLDAGASASRGTLLQSAGLSLGLGTPLLSRALDVSMRYRPSLTRYETSRDAFVEHTVGLGVQLWPGRELEMGLDSDLTTGADVKLLLIQLRTTWRPPI